MDALATGNHNIAYVVIVDNDDYITLEHMEHWDKSGMLPDNVHVLVGARDKTINARVNEAIAKYPADIYSQIVDDCFPLTQHWDAIFHAAQELPAFCWKEMNDPNNATFLVISEKWREATGRFYPEYFPFWFADTWIAEVFLLATGKPIGVINQLSMGGKRGKTQGMRDLAFWFTFFAETRCERIDEAQRVCKAFGTEYKHNQGNIDLLMVGDRQQLEKVPHYETVFQTTEYPSQIYLDAKTKAETWLRQLEAA
jgi:hypothetical protein